MGTIKMLMWALAVFLLVGSYSVLLAFHQHDIGVESCSKRHRARSGLGENSNKIHDKQLLKFPLLSLQYLGVKCDDQPKISDIIAKMPSRDRQKNFPYCLPDVESAQQLKTLLQRIKPIRSSALQNQQCTRCAVVGSAGQLLTQQLGHVIDDYDVVIRMNDAPTVGFEEVVGRKTTYRIVSPLSYKRVISQAEDSTLLFSIRDPEDLAWFKTFDTDGVNMQLIPADAFAFARSLLDRFMLKYCVHKCKRPRATTGFVATVCHARHFASQNST